MQETIGNQLTEGQEWSKSGESMLSRGLRSTDKNHFRGLAGPSDESIWDTPEIISHCLGAAVGLQPRNTTC